MAAYRTRGGRRGMPYVLGVDLGAGSTGAAVARLRHGSWSPPEVVALGTGSAAIPSTLRLTRDGAVAGVDGTGPDIARGFLPRVGDDVPLVVAGRPYRAAALTAELVDQVAARVEEREGGPADRILVAVPGTWGPHRSALLRETLGRVGLDRATLLPAPVAAAEDHAGRAALDVGDTVAVYHLGGTRCECALVRRTGAGTFQLVACAETGPPIGGADLDDALLERVRAELDAPTDRLTLAALREHCTAAREELSGAGSATVRALLPGGQRTVTITREEFEELVAPLVTSTVDTLLAVLRSGPAPVAVLLAGGAARTPLVRRRIAAAVPRPGGVSRIARGAAAAAQRLVTRPDSMVTYRPAPEDGSDPRSRVADVPDPGTEPAYPPPRPPVVITALGAPRRRSARRVAREPPPPLRLLLAGLVVLVGALAVGLALLLGFDPK